MKMSPVGLTSRWVAASRAREAEAPHRLFDDPFAAALAVRKASPSSPRARRLGRGRRLTVPILTSPSAPGSSMKPCCGRPTKQICLKWSC
jgi:hypothetical protein